MAAYLTVDDLVNFLRKRKSKDCQIAADFVTDHPDRAISQHAVDLLEKYALRLEEDDAIKAAWRLLTTFGEGLGLGVYNLSQAKAARVSACLMPIAPRYVLPNIAKPEAWSQLLSTVERLYQLRSPSWAAHIVRLLRGTKPKTKDDEYIVEFLIVKRVRVHSPNNIYAELDAVAKLTPKEREAVHKLRILNGEGKPIMEDEFWTPDKGWWEYKDEPV